MSSMSVRVTKSDDLHHEEIIGIVYDVPIQIKNSKNSVDLVEFVSEQESSHWGYVRQNNLLWTALEKSGEDMSKLKGRSALDQYRIYLTKLPHRPFNEEDSALCGYLLGGRFYRFGQGKLIELIARSS